MLGMRDAQLAKQSPWRKNKHPTAVRKERFELWRDEIAAILHIKSITLLPGNSIQIAANQLK